MESVIDWLRELQLHPVADHFTIALLVTSVAIDLAASLAPSRTWMRRTALTLLILGTIAAAASWLTGTWEHDRLHDLVLGDAHDVLERHELLGEWLLYTFMVLVVWRSIIEAFNFAAGLRPAYLVVALLAVAALSYQAHLGGKLVYQYGVGTQLLSAPPSPAPTPAPVETPAAVATPVPAPSPPGEIPEERPVRPPEPVESPLASEPESPAPTPAPEESPTAEVTPSPEPTPDLPADADL
jgi:uncharacterized membrane protein